MQVTDLSASFAKMSLEEGPAPIIVYNGRGTACKSAEALARIVPRLLDMPAQLVTEEFFKNEPFFHDLDRVRKIRLVILPGGNAREMEAALGSDGLANLAYLIRFQKIPCLAICAGAFLLSERSFFHDTQIQWKPLRDSPRFYHGIASCPVEKSDKELPDWIRKICVKTSQKKVIGNVIYINGPEFHPVDINWEKIKGIKVLARFRTLESTPSSQSPAAIIHLKDFNCVLCGPHPESLFESEISPEFSYTVFQTMLTALGFFKKDKSWNAFFKGIGVKKRPIHETSVSTALEKFHTMPTPVHFLIHAYCGTDTPFLQCLPRFQQIAVQHGVDDLESMRNRLYTVIGKGLAEPSPTIYKFRMFTPYKDERQIQIDEKRAKLLQIMQVSIPRTKFPQRACTLVDDCIKSLVPGSSQFWDLVAFIIAKEKEIAKFPDDLGYLPH